MIQTSDLADGDRLNLSRSERSRDRALFVAVDTNRSGMTNYLGLRRRTDAERVGYPATPRFAGQDLTRYDFVI